MLRYVPQGIYLGLMLFGVVSVVMLHGQERKPEKVQALKSLVVIALSLGLLAWGGFFQTRGLPQQLWLLLKAKELLRDLVWDNKVRPVLPYDALSELFGMGITLWVLWAGGFFDVFR